MKALRLISVALVAITLSIGLSACDNENSDIIGVWEVTNMSEGESGTIEFSKDGTVTVDNAGESHTGKWSRNGDDIYLAAEGEEEVDKLRIVTVDKNSLVIEESGDLIYLNRKK